MTDPQLTRCPGCATVYRVTEAQLAQREGQVRCGHCRAVFDATAHRVERAPAAPIVEPPGAAPDAIRDAVPETVSEAIRDAVPETVSEAMPDAVAEAAGDAAEATQVPEPLPDAAALEAARAALRPRKHRSRSGSTFYATAVVVLVVALAVQSAAFFHDEIVARLPQAAPALATLCGVLTCRTGPHPDAGALSIEGSDLEADPAHRGLLVLTASLRNRAGRVVAWPDIELSLTDSSDRTVVRRVLTPADYLPAGTDRGGLDAHSERQIRLFLDASATRQAGYRLYLFYP